MEPDEPLVHVIDDDDSMRDSLQFLLTSAAIPSLCYASADAFLESPNENRPQGCVLTDIRMPGTNGLELLNVMRRRDCLLPVIMITGHGDIAMAVEAMKAGAFDFIEKPFDDTRLLKAVQAALAFTRSVGAKEEERAEILGRMAQLTVRERQVLDGLVAGQPNKTIAGNLGISPRTVEIYRANVMTKLDAGSLSELVRMAFIAESTPEQPWPAH
ncbi:MAG: response regulator FixJ [Sphingomonadales bacterium]